jgi:hypothetical protein
MANHTPELKARILSTASQLGLQGSQLKALAQEQFGCSVQQLNESQAEEFLGLLPGLAHTTTLHGLTGLGVPGPGGMYKPDAQPAPGKKCARCGKPGMWIMGAGMVLCVRHQDSY